jgi:hypothetical protein
MGIPRQSPPSAELKIFSTRLQKAIEFKKIDIAVLAKNSEYKPIDIDKMLKGMREPCMKKLILLANSLECSVDYLLGLTPEAKRVTVAAMAGTNACKPQLSGHGQTSGQISGKLGPLAVMIPELLESDVELLAYTAGFLINRRKNNLASFAKAVADSPDKVRSGEVVSSRPKIKNAPEDFDDYGLDDIEFDDGLDDDDFDEDEDFEDDDFEDDDFEDDDDFDD